jgi:hypothetical protein
MDKLAAFVRKLAIRLCLLGITGLMMVPCSGSSFVGAIGGENAGTTAAAKPYRPRYNMWNAYAGALYLSGGFSKEFKYESVAGGKLILDYMLSDKVSAGLQAGLYVQSKEGGGAKSPYLGMRVSYHFMEAGWHPRQNHWNVYAGLSAEVEMGGGEKDWHEKSLVGDLHLGARYRLNERWFIWAEAAVNNLSFGLTFAL